MQCVCGRLPDQGHAMYMAAIGMIGRVVMGQAPTPNMPNRRMRLPVFNKRMHGERFADASQDEV